MFLWSQGIESYTSVSSRKGQGHGSVSFQAGQVPSDLHTGLPGRKWGIQPSQNQLLARENRVTVVGLGWSQLSL